MNQFETMFVFISGNRTCSLNLPSETEFSEDKDPLQMLLAGLRRLEEILNKFYSESSEMSDMAPGAATFMS